MAEQLPTRVNELLRNLGQVAAKLEYRAFAVGGFIRDLLLRRANRTYTHGNFTN